MEARWFAWIPAALSSLTPTSAYADGRPDVAMMKPVTAMARFMTTLDRAQLRDLFPPGGISVVENFPPYLFDGPEAEACWEEGFRQHAAAGQLAELAVRFGEPQTFSRDGDRAYFSLPTTWTGLSDRRSFIELGAWSFVLIKTRTGWRVKAYAWAMTSVRLVTPTNPREEDHGR